MYVKEIAVKVVLGLPVFITITTVGFEPITFFENSCCWMTSIYVGDIVRAAWKQNGWAGHA